MLYKGGETISLNDTLSKRVQNKLKYCPKFFDWANNQILKLLYHMKETVLLRNKEQCRTTMKSK